MAQKKDSAAVTNTTQPDAAPQAVTVEIYDQQYNLRGTNPDHVRKLAATVDAKMRAVAANSTTVDSLRVAVLAALNLADELSIAKDRAEAKAASNTMARKANELGDLLDQVLAG